MLAEEVGLGEGRGDVGAISHGEQRQLELGMARAMDPKLMMLDEPAAASRAANGCALTELLRELDAHITLMLIEHDMDVALGVAKMGDDDAQRTELVEGTPEEIRCNETVHELYLGGKVGDEEEQR